MKKGIAIAEADRLYFRSDIHIAVVKWNKGIDGFRVITRQTARINKLKPIYETKKRRDENARKSLHHNF